MPNTSAKVPGRKTDVQDAEWLADLGHAWAAHPEFCPWPGATRPARSHALTPASGAEPLPTGQSPAQDPPRRGNQTGLGPKPRAGGVGASDLAGPLRRRNGPGAPG